jgi:hypothetical protein
MTLTMEIKMFDIKIVFVDAMEPSIIISVVEVSIYILVSSRHYRCLHLFAKFSLRSPFPLVELVK